MKVLKKELMKYYDIYKDRFYDLPCCYSLGYIRKNTRMIWRLIFPGYEPLSIKTLYPIYVTLKFLHQYIEPYLDE